MLMGMNQSFIQFIYPTDIGIFERKNVNSNSYRCDWEETSFSLDMSAGLCMFHP